MAFEQEDIQIIIDAIGTLWSVFFIIFDAIVIKFLELIVDYMTGNIIDNVIFMSLFFVILATALILTFKFTG
jgi:hypothetical protein